MRVMGVDPHAVQAVVRETAAQLGGIDANVFTSAVVPFARVEDITVATWTQSFAVNTIGPALVMAAAEQPAQLPPVAAELAQLHQHRLRDEAHRIE